MEEISILWTYNFYLVKSCRQFKFVLNVLKHMLRKSKHFGWHCGTLRSRYACGCVVLRCFTVTFFNMKRCFPAAYVLIYFLTSFLTFLLSFMIQFSTFKKWKKNTTKKIHKSLETWNEFFCIFSHTFKTFCVIRDNIKNSWPLLRGGEACIAYPGVTCPNTPATLRKLVFYLLSNRMGYGCLI